MCACQYFKQVQAAQMTRMSASCGLCDAQVKQCLLIRRERLRALIVRTQAMSEAEAAYAGILLCLLYLVCEPCLLCN